MFGRNGVKGRKGAGRMMKYMMLSGMMKGKEGGMSAMLPLMLGMKGDFDFMGDLFEEEADEEHKSGRVGVHLAQRATPLIHLMEWTQKENGFILWEAPYDF